MTHQTQATADEPEAATKFAASILMGMLFGSKQRQDSTAIHHSCAASCIMAAVRKIEDE